MTRAMGTSDHDVSEPLDTALVVSEFARWVVRVLGTGASVFGGALLAAVLVALTRQDADAGLHLTPVLRVLLAVGGSAFLAGAVVLAMAYRPPRRVRLPWL